MAWYRVFSPITACNSFVHNMTYLTSFLIHAGTLNTSNFSDLIKSCSVLEFYIDFKKLNKGLARFILGIFPHQSLSLYDVRNSRRLNSPFRWALMQRFLLFILDFKACSKHVDWRHRITCLFTMKFKFCFLEDTF